MAIVLELDTGDGRGGVNYTRYLVARDRLPATLRDRINLPALLDFTLVPADAQFVGPRRGSYVRLTGLADALPPGGPRAPGPLFTGYITNEPVVEFLGGAQGQPVYGYRCQATSEEYLLNIKRVGQLPPFLNQTAGQIVRFLTDQLQPGRFDTSNVGDGALVPLFVARPEQSWSEIARELAERSAFYYRVLDGKVYFQPIGDLPAGVTIDERDRNFRPDSLEVTPLGNPIHNDVAVYGAVEPQAYVREYFVGDGFSSRFPLSAAMFGAESARLLVDDFVGAAIDGTRWQETDPGNYISIFDSRLNITGGTGNLNETTLLARQAVELAGELEFVHGEFEFVSPSSGILGGLYSDSTLTQGNCLLGFDVSPIGGTTRIRAMASGTVQALEVLAQTNHHYILITKLSSNQTFRTEQTFASTSGTFGGASIPALVKVTLEVQDIDVASPSAPVVTVLYEATLLGAPGFVFYAPINSKDLHVVANFLQVAKPIQARLETQKPGDVVRVRKLGFGIAEHDATITSDPNSNQWALEFYEDTIPALGERMVISYRAAGRARARITDATSIAAEAALAGDDGRRAAVLTQVAPAPRSSAEAELAAQAYLADHVAPRYEGRYSTWGRFAQSYPRTGRLLEIRNESRYPVFTALLREVTTEFRELVEEHLFHILEFGQPSRFEELLRQVLPVANVLAGEDESAPAPIDTTEIGTSFLLEAPDFSISSFSGSQFLVDMGAPPPAGGSYEIRRSDHGWGTGGTTGSAQNLLATATSQTFLLPRSARIQAFYIRPVAPSGQTSRFSSLLGLHYPLVPAAPLSLSVLFGVDELGKPVINCVVELATGAIADVLAVELRDADNSTVLARWSFGQLQLEAPSYRALLTLDNSVALLRAKTLYAYTQNALGEYSAATTGTGSQAQPLKPTLAAGNSVGQVLEILLDSVSGPIEETQVQVSPPGGSFSAPAQDITLPGQPEKFNFVATQSGGWAFRARRRDSLGWSPWSDEAQGQTGPQVFIYLVEFFRAPELDPSIGAAINAQNLLPNADFFLPGIAGQEGIHAARYFALVNALADGSELDYLGSTNEMKWKAGVNFAAANPGFRSLLSNLGRILNPGEAVTLSAAVRHTASGVFANAVRLALRSASTPSYDISKDIAGNLIANNYRWYSAAFILPGSQAVPSDLAAEISLVVSAGQSLAAEVFCDKLILNRGQRPAAFGLAPWDVLALAWNASAGAYDLPATAAGGTPRTSDPGNAGLLTGTGTEDLDPDFTGRYTRLT
jgi:hypothetical protein